MKLFNQITDGTSAVYAPNILFHFRSPAALVLITLNLDNNNNILCWATKTCNIYKLFDRQAEFYFCHGKPHVENSTSTLDLQQATYMRHVNYMANYIQREKLKREYLEINLNKKLRIHPKKIKKSSDLWTRKS